MPAEPSLMKVSTSIPLFPLGNPLFPGMVLGLHIFEQRYRQLVADLLEAADTGRAAEFGVVLVREGQEVGPEAATALADIGCLAQVRVVSALPDGRFELTTVGVRRFHLDAVVSGRTPYLTGEVTWLEEPAGDAVQALAEEVRQAFDSYRLAVPAVTGQAALPEDPTDLSYALSAATLLPPADRQRLLAAPDTAERLTLLQRLLEREQALLTQLGAVPTDGFAHVSRSPN